MAIPGEQPGSSSGIFVTDLCHRRSL